MGRRDWRFELANAATRLRQVGDELDAILQAHRAPDHARYAARLVCEELVLNAFEHGRAGSVSLTIDPEACA